MEFYKDLLPLFTAGIFFIGLCSLWAVFFSMLWNLKKEQYKKINDSIGDLNKKIDSNYAVLNQRINEIHTFIISQKT